MISNVLLGTQDLSRAEKFYDQLLALFEAEQSLRNERSILWTSPHSPVGIALCLPFDGEAASCGNGAMVQWCNGAMVGLKATSITQLKQVYQTALALGGQCEGPPGERKPGVHAAYFRDLDGNKFGVFYRTLIKES